MEMRLVKEALALEQPMGAGSSQAVVEGEITLPGGLREEARVLHCGAMTVVDSVEALQDRASVTGKVVFHTLYTQGDPTKVNAIEATADFTHIMELPGAQPRNQCRVEAQVEHAEAAAQGGRLSLRAVVRCFGRALALQPVEAITGIYGVEGVESRAREASVKRTVASGETEVLLREEFALPEGLQIRETLYGTAQPQTVEITGGMGKAGMTGQLMLEVAHASDMPGKPVVLTRHTIPFEQTVEMNGEDGDSLRGKARILDVAVASQEGPEGERTLRAEVLLGLNAYADRRENVTLLDDAYTTKGDDLRLNVRQVRYRTEDHREQAAESGKALLMLPEGSPAVRGVLCAFATPVMTGWEQVGGRLTVEGMLEITLLYMTDDSEAPVSVRQEEPFRVTFAAQAGAGDELLLSLSDVDASAITSDRVEMRYVMRVTISGMESAAARLVTEVLPVAAAAPEGSIILYFTQPGETLWDIARRYRVPVREVKALNPELTGDPQPGQGIVVWRRCQETAMV